MTGLRWHLLPRRRSCLPAPGSGLTGGLFLGQRCWVRRFLAPWILLPIVFLALAWRYLRHPDDQATTGRMLIGGAAILVALVGIWHLIGGAATPSDGADAMGSGGGVIGWVATAPIVSAIGPIVTGIVLVLVLVFGVLVLTATSLRAVRIKVGAGIGSIARIGALGAVFKKPIRPASSTGAFADEQDEDLRALMRTRPRMLLTNSWGMSPSSRPLPRMSSGRRLALWQD